MGRPTLLVAAYDAVSNAIPDERSGYDAVAAQRSSAASHRASATPHHDLARSPEDPLGLDSSPGPRKRARAGRR